MATIITQESPELLNMELNNGDLRALNEIVDSWNFKDKASAIRFALAIMKMAAGGTLSLTKNGKSENLSPADDLLKDPLNDKTATKPLA